MTTRPIPPRLIRRPDAARHVKFAAVRVTEFGVVDGGRVVATAAALEAAGERNALAHLWPCAGRDGYDQIVIQPFPGRRGSDRRYVVDLDTVNGLDTEATIAERAATLHADCAACGGKLEAAACLAHQLEERAAAERARTERALTDATF